MKEVRKSQSGVDEKERKKEIKEVRKKERLKWK